MVLRYWGPVLPEQRQGQLMELSRLPRDEKWKSENTKDSIVYSYGSKTLGPVLPEQRQVERQGQIMELSRLPETSENSTPFFILRKTAPTRGFLITFLSFSLYSYIKLNKQRYKNLAGVFFLPRFHSWFIEKSVLKFQVKFS